MPAKKTEDADLQAQTGEQTGEQEGEQRPDWLPQNFNKPEDLAQSYVELQRRLTEETTARREQQERFEEFLAAQENDRSQAQQQQQGNDLAAAYATAMEDGEYGRALEIQTYMQQQVMQQGLQQFAQQFQGQLQPHVAASTEIVAIQADQMLTAKLGDDWGAYKERVAAEVQADPMLLPDAALQSPQATAKALERVYKSLKADELIAASETAAQQAERLRREKLAAQTVEGAGGRDTFASGDQTKAAWDEIRSADLGSYASQNG